MDARVICFPPPEGLPFACTTLPLTNLAGPAVVFPLDFKPLSAVLTCFGRSKTIWDPGEQYPLPFDRDHPSQTNSPRYPDTKSGRIEGVRDGDDDGLARLRDDEGAEVRDGPETATTSGDDEGSREPLALFDLDSAFTTGEVVLPEAKRAAEEEV